MNEISGGYKKLFASFRRKMVWEGIINSLILALAAFAAGGFAVSFVYHILLEKTDFGVLLPVGGVLAILTFFISYFVFFFPTSKKVSRRIDTMGLQERASTLFDNVGKGGIMAELQRKDAEEYISRTSSKKLKLHIKKSGVVTCLVALLLCGVVLSLPADIFADPSEKVNMDDDQKEIIKELIENLRDKVNNSHLDEEKKEQGNEIIDKLESDLNKTDSRLEQAGKIEEAKNKLDKLFEEALSKNSIGKALQKYEITKQLGIAVEAANTDKVTAELNNLENILLQFGVKIDELGNTIKSALRDSKVPDSDELYKAFDKFASSLLDLSWENTDYSAPLAEIFDTAEREINEILKKQAEIEKEKQDIDKEMDSKKEQILGEKGDKPSDGEKPGDGDPSEGGGDPAPGNQPGDQPGGDKPGDKPGDGGEGGEEGNENGGDNPDKMTEGIFDPVSGEVSYGKVFAAYYAEYLKAIENGEVAPDLKEFIDRYFDELN